MGALAELVLDEEENAILHSELSKYLSQHGPFFGLYANKDQDRLKTIEWWNMFGSVCTHLHRLAVKVLSQVINILLQKGVGAPIASSTMSKETT